LLNISNESKVDTIGLEERLVIFRLASEIVCDIARVTVSVETMSIGLD